MAGVIGAGALSACVAALCYVAISEFFFPLETDEAAGPQFARGMVIFAIVPFGFVGGCALAMILWVKLERRVTRTPGIAGNTE